MTKHTPGPWRMRSHDLMQRIETCEGHTVAIPAMNDGVPALSCSANARLIAAAPDLLAELMRITELYAQAMKNAGVSRYPEALVEVRQARAAIAKATGGE